ncbi:MAG: FG-GAP repeat protein [Pirellulales bacterium]|nr:FG-GAP repeat protein [Pirellulales bacterium]
MTRVDLIVLTAGATLIASTTALAAPGDLLLAVAPDLPIANADFGDAVAIGGNILVVGSEDAPQGSVQSAGAVYLFDATTGAQLRKITPNEPPATRAFGTSVAIDGDRLAIGAEDENSSRGAAYLFHVDGTQLHKLVAPDGIAGDEFGQDVAVSGNVAAVSAPGAGNVGGLYLFDVTTGAQIGGTIRPDDLSFGAEFGGDIAMSGDRVIASVDNFGLGGAAYVYDTTGQLVRKLTLPAEHAAVRGFGRFVSIDGDLALVGAVPSSDQTFGDRGSAFLFNVTTGDLVRKFTPLDSQPDDLFGEGVALSGGLALIAARREDALGIVNTAYLFDVGTGVQLAQLQAAGVLAGDEAFEAIAIDGARILVGHEGFDVSGAANSGRALVFDALVADYDGSLRVDGGDFLLWQRAFGSAGPAADVNGDAMVDAVDLAVWQGNFGLAPPAASLQSSLASVPEPSGVAMFLTLALVTLIRRGAPA